jgi:uncharacterized membrane protein YjjP (DUF1212 family)
MSASVAAHGPSAVDNVNENIERRDIMAKGDAKKSNFFKSKKFTVTLSGFIAVILVNLLGFTQEAATEITTAIMVLLGAFNIGQGVADGFSGGKTSNLAK